MTCLLNVAQAGLDFRPLPAELSGTAAFLQILRDFSDRISYRLRLAVHARVLEAAHDTARSPPYQRAMPMEHGRPCRGICSASAWPSFHHENLFYMPLYGPVI